MRSDIFARVKKIVAAELGIEQTKIVENASLESLGADSMDKICLVMAFEEEFGCEIPDDAADKINTIANIIDHLEKENA